MMNSDNADESELDKNKASDEGKGRFQKKKLMVFSIKLAGWVLDGLVFH